MAFRVEVVLLKAEELEFLEEKVLALEKQVAAKQLEIRKISKWAVLYLRCCDQLTMARDALKKAGMEYSYITMARDLDSEWDDRVAGRKVTRKRRKA